MSSPTNGDEHDRFADDVAAYVLNAMEDAELQPFEEHLARCRECQRGLAALRSAVEALPDAAPERPAPPELRERVMTPVRAEVKLQAPKSETKARRQLWPIAPRRWAGSAIVAAAAAATAAVLVLTGVGSSGRTYTAIVSAPGASASLHQSGSTAQLRVSHLPAPPSGRIYEVWLERDAQTPKPTSALFATSSGSVTVPGNLHGVRAVLVTAEPRPNGSRTPTRSPVIVVRLT
jgi:anti-sigma-K factor RskA